MLNEFASRCGGSSPRDQQSAFCQRIPPTLVVRQLGDHPVDEILSRALG